MLTYIQIYTICLTCLLQYFALSKAYVNNGGEDFNRK